MSAGNDLAARSGEAKGGDGLTCLPRPQYPLRLQHSLSQASQSLRTRIMSDVTLRGTFVMFCDWRGLCTWRSNEEIRLKLGDPIWTELSPESRGQIQTGLGQVVTQRLSQRLEVVNTSGDRFRCWLWPLESPENAVCILGMRLPPKIDQLTDRER